MEDEETMGRRGRGSTVEAKRTSWSRGAPRRLLTRYWHMSIHGYQCLLLLDGGEARLGDQELLDLLLLNGGKRGWAPSSWPGAGEAMTRYWCVGQTGAARWQ